LARCAGTAKILIIQPIIRHWLKCPSGKKMLVIEPLLFTLSAAGETAKIPLIVIRLP
jgi:hypothetical protein